jgi:hypothetical protein
MVKEKLIKSRERVKKFGEVYTPKWVVELMLDAEGVKELCYSVEAKFLEPSAGKGVFLVEVLRRKFRVCRSKVDYLKALCRVYGVELLEDNVGICRENLYKVFLEATGLNSSRVAKRIVNKNIVHGNFLTQKDKGFEAIVFSDYKFKGNKIFHYEYTLSDIKNKVKKDSYILFK